MMVAIVGGGITGLACAYELTRERGGPDVALLEASARLGGKILTDADGDLVLEAGPDSFVTNKPWALELARELGLASELVGTDPRDRSVFVFSRGRLRRFPQGLMLMAPSRMLPFLASNLLPWKAKLRMGLERYLPARARGDESIGDFVRRRFGPEALETVAGPVLAGIHAGDPDALSLRSTFPQFAELERRYGSVLKGLEAPRPAAGAAAPSLFMTLREGLGSLADALAARLPVGAARLKSPVAAVARAGDRWRVETAGGAAVAADAVVLTLPADRAARALKGVDPGLAGGLEEIPFSSTATVSLAYDARDLPRPLEGHGFVVDRREGLAITAATFTSRKFPERVPPGMALIRCFLGGAGREAVLAEDDGAVAAAAQRDLALALGWSPAPRPRRVRVYRWPRANPQYNVGHEARLKRLEERLAGLPGLLLAGSSYRGVGIPDCVRSGREAARRLLSGPGVPSGVV